MSVLAVGQQQGGFGGFSQGGFGGFSGNNDSFQDIFGDIFGDVFGGRPGGGGGGFKQTRKQRGADLRYTLNISFEESATGIEKPISFVRSRSGTDETTRLSVRVPSGVKHGQRLRLAGEGDAGPNGGPAGDLYVVINILEHSLFKREEDDVVIEVPVKYVDAILGAQIEIPTLTGRVAIRIPPGTYSGQILRVKGKGFPKAGGFGSGDLLVRILVDTPSQLSGKQKELLEELAKSCEETPQVKVFNEKVSQLLRNRK